MTDKNYIEKNLCTEGLDASKTKLYCSNDLEWKKLLSKNYFNKTKLNDSFLFAMICEAAINNQDWNCEGRFMTQIERCEGIIYGEDLLPKELFTMEEKTILMMCTAI